MFHRTTLQGIALLLSIVTGGVATAQTPNLAPTPPMGWNSWDAYGTTIVEKEVRDTIDKMAADLKPFGWQYVVIDIQWSEPNPKSHGYRVGTTLTMDRLGRLIPAPNRFPSSTSGSGFKTLADYAHSKGLKLGIHIMRGIPRQAVKENTPIEGSLYHAQDIADLTSTCSWNTDMYGVDMKKPGAQAYYDSLAGMYAQWGLDFIKADDMSRPYHADEIEALHHAILKTGRPMTLSLSPGPAPTSEISSLRENAQMWRIADDLWDDWKSVKEMYFRMETWAPLVEPGHWPDADMLPLGHIGLRAERGDDRLSHLTHAEQQTVMTMWSMFRSPLMFGGDLLTLDPYTQGLITNKAVLGLDQHSQQNKLALKQGELRAWTATTLQGKTYIALVNLSNQPTTFHVSWKDLSLARQSGTVTEIWTKEKNKAGDGISADLPPHGSTLYSIEP